MNQHVNSSIAEPAFDRLSVPEKPRILHVMDHLGYGGAQKFALGLARQLKQAEWDVALCSLRGPRELSEEANQLGIPIWHLGRKVGDPRQLIDLIKLIRNQRFQLIHTHDSASAVIGPLAARLAGAPHVVVHDQNGSNFWKGSRPWVGLERALYLAVDWSIQHLVDRVLVVSEFVAEYRRRTHRAIPGRLRVLPNFVDLSRLPDLERSKAEIRRELGLAQSAFIVGTAGRLAPEKGQAVLLEAMAKFLPDHPDALLLIAGDGPLRSGLEDRALALGISNQVRFLGWRNDILRVLAAVDVFALPSHFETCGIVLLEAMAMGIPVVASAVGGIVEAVPSSEVGTLVPSNDPTALAQAIRDLAMNADRRASTGVAGKRRIEQRYSLEASAAHIERIYTELVRAS